MMRKRSEIRGVLTLATVLRLSGVGGFAIGIVAGVFYGIVKYLLEGNLLELIITIVVAPPFNASLFGLVTLIAYPLYVVLGRAGIVSVDKLEYEATVE